MTSTDTVRCRHCHGPIVATAWRNANGWPNCENGGDHEPACRVVDTVVNWADDKGRPHVQPGDLVLTDGQFDIIEEIAVQVGPDGTWSSMTVVFRNDPPRQVHRNELVAVRRYVDSDRATDCRWVGQSTDLA